VEVAHDARGRKPGLYGVALARVLPLYKGGPRLVEELAIGSVLEEASRDASGKKKSIVQKEETSSALISN
jgi:hypothetical protein